MTNTELPALRKALDGLAFAAHQAGQEGRSVSECGDVADWIAEAVRAALAAQSALTVTDIARMAGGSMLSWSGFNVYGNAESIAAVRQALHDAGTVPELKQRIAAQSAPAAEPGGW